MAMIHGFFKIKDVLYCTRIFQRVFEPRELEFLILISDKAYTRNEVLDMEKLMLNILHFNMSVPTAYVFIRRFLKTAQADRKGCIGSTVLQNTTTLQNMKQQVFFLITHCCSNHMYS
ncbi:hypothetical protein Ahy_A09g046518 [Arachis hypogaea]|uniref:B-like cyclin n=1 Tax=Arachis hypogaea TaxID=3818 RepID=A0A445BQ18_ARAHY|nr:hypothetical protein Ahy_A09g046518 [Arachis hypogaea]